MQKDLPLNRKEIYWTSCVLPSIICGEKFNDLSNFLKFIGVPKKFIKQSYEDQEIDFYTEYCLQDSALSWNKKLSGETPDLLILLKNINESFLIFVEAKMFNKVTSKQIRSQLNDQKKIRNVIMKELDINDNNFLHTVLFLQRPSDFIPLDKEVVINWKDICKEYAYKVDNYFYRKLKLACEKTELMSSGAQSYGKNSTDKLKWVEIYERFKDTGNFYVGRRGNIQQVSQDCDNGKVRSFRYEVNTELRPGIDKAPGSTGENWFSASEFVDKLRQKKIIIE